MPIKLKGEGEYNINVLTKIDITDSYYGLDEDIRECQNEEPQDNCTTRLYVTTILNKCGCLPLNMRLSDKVFTSEFKYCMFNVNMYNYLLLSLGTSLLFDGS